MKRILLAIFLVLTGSLKICAQSFTLIPLCSAPCTISACSDNNSYSYTLTQIGVSSAFNVTISFAVMDGVNPWIPKCSGTCEAASDPHVILYDLILDGNPIPQGNITNANGSATFNISDFATDIAISFKLKLDCAIADNQNQQMNLKETWSTDLNYPVSNNVLDKVIDYPVVTAITQSPVTFTSSYLNNLTLEFEYKIVSSAASAIYVSLEFLNPDLVTCMQNQTIINSYNITGVNNGNDFDDTQPELLQSIEVLPNVDCYIMIRQTVDGVTSCLDNCTNKSARLKWYCSNADPTFCTQCKIYNITGNSCSINYNLNNPAYTGLTLTRLLPTPSTTITDKSRNDVSCPGEELEWEYVIENVSSEKFQSVEIGIADGLPFDFNSGVPNGPAAWNESAPAIGQLTIIYESSFSYEFEGNGQPSQIRHDDYGINHTDYHYDVSYNTSPSCPPNGNDQAINSYRIVVSDLLPGQKVHFRFKTYRCCSQDEDLYNLFKIFNNWYFQAKVRTECGNFFVAEPTSSQPPTLNGTGNYPGYISDEGGVNPNPSTTSCNLRLEFAPTVSDMTGPGPNDPPAIPTPFFVETKGFIRNQADMLGITQDNLNTMHGILRVKIHCPQGLKVTDINSQVYFENSLGMQWPKIGCYSVLASTPELCVAGDYFVYYNMNDPLAFEILNNGKFHFSLTPCCDGFDSQLLVYSVSFDLLMNDNLCSTFLSGIGDCTNPATCSGISCCWLPLSKESGEIYLHCPGCKAPGIIVNRYDLERKFLGLVDDDNDGVANSNTVIDNTYIHYADVMKKYSNHGDVLEDRMKAFFVDGAPFPDGYTYGDMGGTVLDVLQLSRTITYAGAAFMNLMPESFTLYVCEPNNPNNINLTCIECNDFGLDPSNFKTVARLDNIPLGSLNVAPYLDATSNILDVNRTYLFTFPVNLLLNSIPQSPFIKFDVGQQYLLKVTYKECGNFLGANYYSLDIDDFRKKSTIDNMMWLTGSAKNLGDPIHQMPMTINNVNELNETFANGHEFFCETFKGLHYFFALSYPVGYSAVSVLPGNQCKLEVSVNAFASIDGAYLRNFYPFEYKAVPALANSLKLSIPEFWKITSGSSTTYYSFYPETPNNATSLPEPFSFSPVSGPAFLNIPFNQFAAVNCFTDVADITPSQQQFASDEYTSQTFKFIYEPIDGCQNINIQQFIHNNDPDFKIEIDDHYPVCYNHIPISCTNNVSSSFIPQSPLILNEPKPNLTYNLPVNPCDIGNTQVLGFTEFNLTISNFTDAQHLDASGVNNLFIAVPYNSDLMWELISPCQGSNIVSPFDNNGYTVIPIGNLAINSDCDLTLRATLSDCPLDITFPWNIGWSCEEITSGLNPEDACYFVALPCTLGIDTKEVEPAIVDVTPQSEYSNCENFAYDFAFQSNGGPLTPTTVLFDPLPAGLTFQECYLLDCITHTIISPALTPTGNDNEFAIPPGITLDGGGRVCFRAMLHAECTYSAPYSAPGIKISGTTFCNSSFSVVTTNSPSLNPPQASSCCFSCNNFGISYTTQGCTITFTATGETSPACSSASYTWNFGDGSPTETTSSVTISHPYLMSGTYPVSYTLNCLDGEGNIIHTCDVSGSATLVCSTPCESFSIISDKSKNCKATFTLVFPPGYVCNNPAFIWYNEGVDSPGSQTQELQFTHEGQHDIWCNVFCNGVFICKVYLSYDVRNCNCEDFKIGLTDQKNCSVTYTAIIPPGYDCANPVYQWWFDGDPEPGPQTITHLFNTSGYHDIWCEVFCDGVIVNPPDCKAETSITLDNCNLAKCILLEDGLGTSEKANQGRDVIKTSDGGYIVIGDLNESFSDKDIYAVKYNQNDLVDFNIRYGDGGGTNLTETASSVVETADAYFITGTATNNSTNESDIVVTKILKNPLGNIQWSNRYDFGDDDIAKKIIDLNDGRLLIVGYTNSRSNAPASDYDALAMTVLGTSGILNGQNIYGNTQSSKSEYAFDAVKIANSNDVVLAGAYVVPGGRDALFIRIHTNTNLSLATPNAVTILAGPRLEQVNSITQSGNFLWATGSCNSYNINNVAGDTDIFVAKILPADLSLQGFHLFGNTQFDEAGNKIRKTSDGNLIIAGYRRSSTQKYDALELKLQTTDLSSGYWSKITSYPTYNNLFNSVDELSPGKYLLTGYYTAATQNSEIFNLKTDESGSTCCLTDYVMGHGVGAPPLGSSFNAQMISFNAIDISNNSISFISETDLCSSNNLRVAQVGKDNINKTNNSGISVYPNPADNSFNIELNKEDDIIRDIKLYDVTGRQVEFSRKPPTGGNTIRVDVSNFSDGIYIVEVRGLSKKFTSKISIQK